MMPRRRSIQLAKLFEDDRLIFGLDSEPRISDRDFNGFPRPFPSAVHAQFDPSALREFDCIGYQLNQDLL